MEFDEEKLPQCPAGSAVGRRKGEESRNKTVELTLGMKTSKPVVSFELSSCFCKDSEACMCKNRLFDTPSPLCLSPATAAAQTQMLSTKPKAMALIACRQLTDGNEAASLRDQWEKKAVLPRPCLQVEERKQQVEKERQKKAVDDQKHNETQQQTWGMPRSGAQNHQQGTVKRSRNLDTAGILPQEQVNNALFTVTKA
ncbi:Major outer membrane protein [Dissostichus eleginoides]|uniref:Major outer membrane protein n=1 Tax=Dissostichus eleginoides TaxID=100907 RepID=A0AAD9F0S1_DISEL|nr:Major outer membrane protein [Dissostichus eleginoides]